MTSTPHYWMTNQDHYDAFAEFVDGARITWSDLDAYLDQLAIDDYGKNNVSAALADNYDILDVERIADSAYTCEFCDAQAQYEQIIRPGEYLKTCHEHVDDHDLIAFVYDY